MKTYDDFDRVLAGWFDSDALPPAPVGLLGEVSAATACRRPRPGWLADLRGHWVGSLDQVSGRGTQRAHRLATALLIALLMALLVGVGVFVGSQLAKPTPTRAPDPVAGVFTPSGSMTIARENAIATLLRDGRVFVVGGHDAGASAEIWDPIKGVFSPGATLAKDRWAQTATLLPSGRVLVVGGTGSGEYGSSADVWDPSTLTFSATGSMAVARSGIGAESLSDGRVLVVGGYDLNGAPAPPEVWDPDTGVFSPATSLPEAQNPAGTLLADGRILIIDDSDDPAVWDSVTRLPVSFDPTSDHGYTATRLQDGRVLVVGGYAFGLGPSDCVVSPAPSTCTVSRSSSTVVASAEIWDPAADAFHPTGSLGQARSGHAAVVLSDGRVLVVGGSDNQGVLLTSAEVYQLK